MKTDLFQSCGHCWVFQICWHFECSPFTASSFRIWNSSPGIPSPPLALFIVMLSKAHFISHSRMWIILQEMGIPDHLTYLLRNLYTGQEETVRTGHGTTDWFQIEKGVCQGCILSPWLFNLYAEYIMRYAGLDKAKPWIKFARRNINNLKYADNTTLMQESKEEPFDEAERGE